MKERRTGVPLRWLLIIAFVIEAVVASGWVAYLSYSDSRRRVSEIAGHLRQETSAAIERHVERFLDTPRQINELNARSIRDGVLPPDDPELLARAFWDQVQVFDTVSSIYFGNTAGGVIDAGREGAGGPLYFIGAIDSHIQ